MEIRQLEYFLAAAEELSFTGAARKCFTVQSAVSQQIALLEKELGAALFTREKRALRLTPEGEVFLKEAQTILGQMQHAASAVRSLSEGYRETLHIGRHGDLLREDLPAALRRLLAQRPGIRLAFTNGNPDSLMEQLESGWVDCVLSVLFPEHRLYQWLEYRVVRRESLRIMIAADHPLAARESIAMAEANRIPLFLLRGGDKKGYLADLAGRGFTDSACTYVDSQNGIEQMVAAGCGISILAESACRAHSGLRYLRPEEEMYVDIALFWNKNRVPASLETLIGMLDGREGGSPAEQ